MSAIPDAAEHPALKVKDVTAILGVGERAIYEAVARNEFPHRWIGRRLIIPTAELRRWLGVDPEPAA